MGLSSSRLKSGPRVNRPKRRGLSSLICCGSSSRAPVEFENRENILVNSAEHSDPLYNEIHSHIKESFSFSGSDRGFMSPKPETEASSESSVTVSEGFNVENAEINAGSTQEKCLYESTELVPLHQPDAQCSAVDSRGSAASTSSKRQDSSESASISARASISLDTDNGHSVNADLTHCFPEAVHTNSPSPNELGDPLSGSSADSHVNDIMGIQNYDPAAVPVSDLSLASPLQRDESVQRTMTSGPEFLVSDSGREQSNGSVLHVDVVSISSNILSRSTAVTRNREARRNSRRLLWDAFPSRLRSRRQSDSPSLIFPSDDNDNPESHDRWLLNISGDFFGDGIGSESGRFSSRIQGINERRSRTRSEVWERLRGGLTEIGRRATICPSGLHLDGTCSCESSAAGESGTRENISRIVMLAEALFEVLDEIHRQPASFSLSMVSLPAPEALVDSFPLKSHKRPDTSMWTDDLEQCYICLAEYEDGDKIRVLPCRHEYHMSCVDKWLKEIHGVCPLCRGDVREGTFNEGDSNSTAHL